MEARGIHFRGHSDTEVMLEAFAVFGVAATVKRLIGMFTIGVWDRRERTLTLVRDRLGIKPLYWAKFGNLFLFGSELKALRAYPGWTPHIDRGAVAAFMRHNYIPAPHTIYQGVQKLEPGCILTLPWGGEPQIERFWDARVVARAGLNDPLRANDSELTDQLETLLKDAVRRRMVADVPVGAFLSGGIDSSTVVALMKAANAGPVRTYTIGFELAGFDEADSFRGRRPPPRHRPHRTDGHREGSARRDPAAAGYVRRTVCRFLPNPDLSCLRDDPPARHRRAFGRRRR